MKFIVSRWILDPQRFEVYTSGMSMNLPLREMTLQEKLAAMELLWEHLSHSPESVESPTWHKDTLDERRQGIAEGKAQFADWETAKTEIRKKLL